MKVLSKSATKLEFRRLVSKNLPRWDRDGNGKLSPDEINPLVGDRDIRGLDAVTLGTIKWGFQKFPDTAREGVDSEHLFQGKSHLGTDVFDKFEEYRENLNRPDCLFEGGRPDPQSIKQGMRGSCVVLAALICQSKNEPQALLDSITEDGDNYRVRLGGRDECVSKPTETERITGAQSNGIWATVVEKAVAQQNWKELPPTGDVYDNLRHGVSTEDLISELSGQDSTTILSLDAPGVTKEARDALLAQAAPYPVLLTVVHQALAKAKKKKQIVTAASSIDPRTGQVTYGSHAYAITDYDPKKLEVTIQNPWGFGEFQDLPKDGKDDGVFKTSLDGLLAHFHTITVGSDETDSYIGKGAAKS